MSPRLERRLDLSLAVALFVLALVPRMLGLDAFLTIDEPAWVSRSARFTQALLRGDFADTFPTSPRLRLLNLKMLNVCPK
jgi:hypothetical protein